jgi:hypothetical protein
VGRERVSAPPGTTGSDPEEPPRATIVLTETSTYVVNWAANTVRRIPGVPIKATAVAASSLREDEEEIELLAMLRLEVGQPMEMYLNLRRDGILTFRRTTLVMAILD